MFETPKELIKKYKKNKTKIKIFVKYKKSTTK
jgi:hypothetical protein